MIKKIVITGPESSGKTTLAQQLAQELSTVWVPEYARTFIEKLDRPYEEADLLEISHGQLLLEEEKMKQANRYLICDTDLLTIKIWSEIKYDRCAPSILREIERRNYDLYFLMYPDIPWVFDPQRENPDSRETLFSIYRSNLEQYHKKYYEIKGSGEERLSTALNLLSNDKD